MSNVIRKALLNRSFLTLFACYVLACTCFAFVNVGMLLHATEDFGMNAVIIGSVLGLVSIIGLFMRPVSAILVDALNRKRILVFAFALEALATFGFAYADQYYLMYALQCMRGIAWGLINCAGVVVLVQIVGREDFGMASGIYALGMVIGSSIASAVVATLGDMIGFTATFNMASCMTALAALLAMTLPIKGTTAPKDEQAPQQESIMDKIKAIRFRDAFSIECAPIMGISFAFQLSTTALGATFLVAYGRIDLGIANVGIAATLYNVIMYVTRPVYGRIMDKYGARWCIIPTFIGFIAANIIAANSSDMTGLLIAAVVYGLCSGGNAIAPRAMAIRRLGPGREAVAASTAGIGNDLGMFLGNVLVPAVAVASGRFYRNAYLVIALIACIGLAYSLLYTRLYIKKHPDNSMQW